MADITLIPSSSEGPLAETLASELQVLDIEQNPGRKTPKQGSSVESLPEILNVPWLLALPLELRQHIYGDIFHGVSGSASLCDGPHPELGQQDCRCGEGLSVTNRKLHNETRGLFFRCATFTFNDPTSCRRYLDKIGRQVVNLGSLSISYKDTYEQSEELNNIFHKFRPESSLHTLWLKVISSRSSRVLPPPPRPIYLPSARTAFPATFYDLSWRPAHRPLADIISIKNLTVVGYPGMGEVEEAIFQLSLKIENQAKVQGKTARIAEKFFVRSSDWFYSLEVLEVVS